jgi:hypothetical protein
VLSDQDLEQATKEGEQKDQATPDPQTLKG